MDLIRNEVLREEIYKEILDNGLEIYVLPKKDYVKQFAIFATRYGSIDNDFILPDKNERIKVPDGIAHFLEHKLFEEEEGNVFDRFTKNGANANAYTSFTLTAYLFSCTYNFYENLKILLNFVSRPYFTEESVKKEIGIIEQEINMYKDDPNWRVFFNILDCLYVNHPVKIDIAGTVDSIKKINKDLLYKCYNTFYNPNNMVLFVVGNVNPERVVEESRNMIIKEGKAKIKRFYPEEPESINRDFIEDKMMVAEPLMYLGYKDISAYKGSRELLKRIITTNICLELLIGKSSKLYNDLYNEGLITSNFDFEYTGEIGYGYTLIGGEVSDPIRVSERIKKGVSVLVKEGIDGSDFERIKKKLYGSFVRSFNSIDAIAHNFISFYMKDIFIFDYISAINDITAQDVLERFQTHFKDENSALSVITPLK